MKLFVACVVSLVVLNFVSAKPAEEKYTTKYDNIDYKNILNSNRLLANYMKCLLEGKGCTPAGKEMRVYLPDALKTDCAKCSERQKKIGKEIFDFMIKNKPNEYKQLEDKFDPDGEYRKRYNDRINPSP